MSTRLRGGVGIPGRSQEPVAVAGHIEAFGEALRCLRAPHGAVPDLRHARMAPATA